MNPPASGARHDAYLCMGTDTERLRVSREFNIALDDLVLGMVGTRKAKNSALSAAAGGRPDQLLGSRELNKMAPT